MAKQNRVDPFGNLNANSSHGSWMGNRGILHNEHQEIVAQWRHKSWVTCRLEYKGRKREIFSPGNYSELFFLDEATAFSAGHRPCAECRRDRYNDFKASWCSANIDATDLQTLKIAEIDKQLHCERVAKHGEKITFQASYSSVPDGAFISLNDESFLKWRAYLLHWSAKGYDEANCEPDPSAIVSVITPISIVRMFANGFSPQVHESADRVIAEHV